MIDPQSISSCSSIAPDARLVLEFGVSFPELYERTGLVKLDQIFLNFLNEGDPELYSRLTQARQHPEQLLPKVQQLLPPKIRWKASSKRHIKG